MSQLIIQAILDGDTCEILECVPYSTNPRELVTIKQMEQAYENTK
jgi:hypothetical protein